MNFYLDDSEGEDEVDQEPTPESPTLLNPNDLSRSSTFQLSPTVYQYKPDTTPTPTPTTPKPSPTVTSAPITIAMAPAKSSPKRVEPKKEPKLDVPIHPIPSMQEAFAESMQEVADGVDSKPAIEKDALARRKRLLDQDVNDPVHAGTWKRRPGQKYHEFWKLLSQISFGIYLLLNGIARDEDQVINILQGHVDEVDQAIETTLEDFDLAQQDIDERLEMLQLPLANITIFDGMLEDREFRNQIVTGNEKIEHCIQRTAMAMNAGLKDVKQGIEACKEFSIYLAQEQEDELWKQERPDMQKVFEAMKGNVEGWYKAYVSLQTKGNHLAAALVQLGTTVAEMDKRAGEVSRKYRFSTSPTGSPTSTNPLRSSRQPTIQMRRSMSRELPTDPGPITPAIRAALPAFQLVDEREPTPEDESDEESVLALAEPEPEFTLKPHTYSPFPSPKVTQAPSFPAQPLQSTPPQEPPRPEISKRASLRQRFSLKRKETPSEITIKAPQEPSDENYWGPRQPVKSVSRPPPHKLETTVKSPPSRGLDSAYCSDYEKPSSPENPPNTTLPPQRFNPFPQPPRSVTNTPTSTAFNSPRVPPPPPQIPERAPERKSQQRVPAGGIERIVAPSILTQEFLPSPASERQFFRPVNASPNSPLQRPWTAAPDEIVQIHSNGSTTNLRYGSHTPSQLGNRNRAPSAMNMSMMSDMTTMTENGKKVKKKRSAFGWLKKAFSLSEEEKAAFEERRRMTDADFRKDHARNEQQRWLDGKRIR
ncbi:hypothetical protein HYFRA_00011049 [Hymenoscyphus fraxineus]|uniref:Uncharacterized protein n=1 Tax=Hymenoscyphus fraxineus TaxID=746836 RepID=A0A9N9PY66_9HELO|nr:hypothetical protein HYFRA_00011049 [Hymenoscyphus fraxineus]